MKDLSLPFRIGTTSYIIPDDILPNARYLAGKVQDIELVLFEVDDGPNNLPDQQTIDELIALAADNRLSYTVHLPLDLRLGSGGDEQHVSLRKAHKVIQSTRSLEPWAYVLHLDGRDVQTGADPEKLGWWQEQAVRALEITSGWVGRPDKLAVENLEGYPLEFWELVLERIPVGRCIDIGHLWLDGHDPMLYLEAHLAQARVLHMHGIQERDHCSLAAIPTAEINRVITYLIDQNYRGVATIEVFSEADFQSSMQVLKESVMRIGVPATHLRVTKKDVCG